MFLGKNKTKVIWGKLNGQDYVLQEENESAKKITYQQWHEALGHPSSNYIKSHNCSDTTDIPKLRKDWQCEIYITSKSTKWKPTTTILEEQAKESFNLIYSDLRGRFLKTYFGK